MAAQQLPAIHPHHTHPHLPHHLGAYHQTIAAAGMSAHNYMLQAAAAAQHQPPPSSNPLAQNGHSSHYAAHHPSAHGHLPTTPTAASAGTSVCGPIESSFASPTAHGK